MTLHHDATAFQEAIALTAGAMGIRQELIEKDYWVTWVLRNLAESELADQVVFKGGTSLSKAWKMIARFSEDVDLAVIPPQATPGAVRRLITQVHHVAVGRGTPEELTEVAGGTKLGRNRRVEHQYPKLFTDASLIATEHILLEITHFGHPHPFVKKPIISYVGEHLQGLDPAAVTEYGLAPFNFNVLTLGRTLAEKVLALVRASYTTDPAAEIARKVRHLYDLHFLLLHPEVVFQSQTALFGLLRAVQADDATAGVAGPTQNWKQQPLAASWAFTDAASNLVSARRAYEQELALLVHEPAPAFNTVLASMQQLAELLERFDALR